jgi:hypothetical protein
MIKKILAWVLLLLTWHSTHSQPYFNDFASIANQNIIEKYFFSSAALAQWPKQISHAQGFIIGGDQMYQTRKFKIMNGLMRIDSTVYLNNGHGKYEMIANVQFTIDTINRTYKRIDIPLMGDTIGYAESRFDAAGRLEYISGRFFYYSSGQNSPHHYLIEYDERSLIKRVTGYNINDSIIEEHMLKSEINYNDSSLSVSDNEILEILRIKKQSAGLLITGIIRLEGKSLMYSNEYSQTEKGLLNIYSRYKAGSKSEKMVIYEETTSVKGNEYTTTTFYSKEHPRPAYELKTTITLDPARPYYLLYKVYYNGKLNFTVEEE